MSEPPLVSIVLTNYDFEPFVSDALDGMFSQDYPRLELIIIDDCSQDRSAAIIEAKLAAQACPFEIHFIRNPTNIGAKLSITRGLELAKGEFVVMSSGDDVTLPGMISEMVRTWRARNVSLVTVNAFYMDEHSVLTGTTVQPLDRDADDSFETLVRDGANACCFGAGIGFGRDVFDTFGFDIDPFLGAYDIIVPFFAYLLKGACFINAPLMNYRVHQSNTSLSLKLSGAQGIEQLRVLERIHYQHLAHSIHMRDVVENKAAEDPARYGDVARKIIPLLAIQTIERSRKLISARKQLNEQISSHITE